jgi:hypothetical protein
MQKVFQPLLMVVILEFSLCLHEIQQLMITMDNDIFPNNVMPPLMIVFHNGLHFLVIIRVLTDDI